MANMVGTKVPQLVFKTRVRDDELDGPNPYRWKNMYSDDYFKNKRVILFALPGAFTPTCSNYQLPEFEEQYEEFKSLGIDEIYCMSVNDAFVMNAWANSLSISNVKMIPDGNGHLTKELGMYVGKFNLGFGMRSWRYAAIINNGEIEAWFEEPGYSTNCEKDPYGESSPENLLKYLKG